MWTAWCPNYLSSGDMIDSSFYMRFEYQSIHTLEKIVPIRGMWHFRRKLQQKGWCILTRAYPLLELITNCVTGNSRIDKGTLVYPPPPTWDWGTPLGDRRASTCYAAGGMPLAVTQEDFLVFILDQTRSIVAENAGYWGISFPSFWSHYWNDFTGNLHDLWSPKTGNIIFIGLTFVHFISVLVDKRFNKAKPMYTKNTFIYNQRFLYKI